MDKIAIQFVGHDRASRATHYLPEHSKEVRRRRHEKLIRLARASQHI